MKPNQDCPHWHSSGSWGVSYPTAWLIQHKLMQAMAQRDTAYKLEGLIQIDDAYLGLPLTR